jgi:hypothetical protein
LASAAAAVSTATLAALIAFAAITVTFGAVLLALRAVIRAALGARFAAFAAIASAKVATVASTTATMAAVLAFALALLMSLAFASSMGMRIAFARGFRNGLARCKQTLQPSDETARLRRFLSARALRRLAARTEVLGAFAWRALALGAVAAFIPLAALTGFARIGEVARIARLFAVLAAFGTSLAKFSAFAAFRTLGTKHGARLALRAVLPAGRLAAHFVRGQDFQFAFRSFFGRRRDFGDGSRLSGRGRRRNGRRVGRRSGVDDGRCDRLRSRVGDAGLSPEGVLVFALWSDDLHGGGLVRARRGGTGGCGGRWGRGALSARQT